MPPTILIESLHGIRRKVKVLGVLFGAGVVLAAAVGLLLLTVLLDYLLNLPAPVRVVAIVAAVAALGYALVRWVARPALARMSISDVAGRLEVAFPQFDDRLRSTVDFMRTDMPGSQVMKDRTVLEATRLAQATELDRAIVTRPVWAALAAAGGAVVVLLALGLLVSPNYRHIALSRLLTPFSGQAWPKTVQIELVDKLPGLVPVGEPINVRLKLSRGDNARRKAIIHYRYGDGTEHVEEMVRGDDGTYSVSLDARAEANQTSGVMRAWVEAGDDEQKLDDVRIVPRLAIERIIARVTPPGYAKLEPATTDLSAVPAIATIGSTVQLHIDFNKALLAGSDVVIEPVAADGKAPAAKWEVTGGKAVGTWTAAEGLRFRVRATDEHRFRNTGLEEFELIVKPDVSPTVQIENPRGTEQRTAVAFVPLQAVAEDDYGLRTVTLVVDRLGENKKHWEVPLVTDSAAAENVGWTTVTAAQDRQRFRLNYQWELRDLAGAELKPGDTLEYYVLVQDNFELPGAPGAGTVAHPDKPGYVMHPPVPSGRLRISIISEDQLEQQLMEVLANIGTAVDQLKTTQTSTRTQTEQVKGDTETKPALDNADQAALKRLGDQQNVAASTAKQLSQKAEGVLTKMEENRFNPKNSDVKDVATDVKAQLNDVAENPMKDAGQQLNQAQQSKGNPKAAADSKENQQSTQQRNEALDKAQAAQKQAEQKLDETARRLQNMRPLAGFIKALRENLAAQEKLSGELDKLAKENLGKKPDEMKPEDRDKLDKLSKDQQKEADKNQKLMDAMDKAGSQMSKSDPQSAQAMSKAAQMGKQQQVPQKQSQASQQAKQNQMSSASASQKQAELGLQMMLQELRDAERRQLADLVAKLRELEQQVADLIRRQAGHNHDDLRMQGDEVMKRAGQDLIDALVVLSNRKGQEPAVPALGGLSDAQGLTERNTRTIGKGAEKIKSGAEVAANLTKAANEMERAVVYLRDTDKEKKEAQKLAAAYDPPMVRALSALQDAMKKVEELRNQAEKQQEDAQREAVKQAYERIKAEQVKLNGETVEADKLPRGADGQFRWEDRAKVAPLPGKQEGLAKDVEKVGKDLEELDSVVYSWVNKDIHKKMTEVKEQLAKPDTGQDTQVAEAKIADMLQEMIDNLIETQRMSDFTQRPQGGGGGGGGGQKPRIPTEPELRMLKALQKLVLKDTTQADKEPNKDKPWVTAIGGRQGELRNLLDMMMQKLRGQGLGPEPDPKDKLPEDAKISDIEGDELVNQLLGKKDPKQQEKPGATGEEQVVDLIGTRMARSRQRMVIDTDPGQVTQEYQKRVLKDLDELIKQAQKTMQQQQSQAQAGRAQKPGEKPEQGPQQAGQPKPNQASNAAKNSQMSGGGDPNAQLTTGELEERLTEWGRLTPRLRDAIIEGNSEKTIPKYDKYTNDYYRSLAEKATEHK